MRPTLFALPLLAATVAFGQTQQSTPAPIVAPINPSNIQGKCPVGMAAQRSGTGQTLWAIALEDSGNQKNEAAARAANSGVHVELNTRNKSAIRQVELTVDFIAPGTFFLPVAETTTPIQQKKTFHLSAQDGASRKLVGDLLIGPAAGITRVHLLSIAYANGSNWAASANNACSVEPNGFIRVAAR
jgi:hypothetical protein